MITIKNINGTTDNICKCGSWLKHWKKFSGQKILFCIESSCTGYNLVGAHVQKANSTDHTWYIIPLCKEHSKSKGEIEVLNDYTFVSANKQETCEKG